MVVLSIMFRVIFLVLITVSFSSAISKSDAQQFSAGQFVQEVGKCHEYFNLSLVEGQDVDLIQASEKLERALCYKYLLKLLSKEVQEQENSLAGFIASDSKLHLINKEIGNQVSANIHAVNENSFAVANDGGEDDVGYGSSEIIVNDASFAENGSWLRFGSCVDGSLGTLGFDFNCRFDDNELTNEDLVERHSSNDFASVLSDGAITRSNLNPSSQVPTRALADGFLDPNGINVPMLTSRELSSEVLDSFTIELTTFEAGTITSGQINGVGFGGDDFASGSITNEKLRTRSFVGEIFQNYVVTAEHLELGTIVLGDFSSSAQSELLAKNLSDGALTPERISDGSITSRALESNLISSIEVGGNVFERAFLEERHLSEDLKLRLLPKVGLSTNVISSISLATNTIASYVILDESILSVNIATNAVLTRHIAVGTIQSRDITVGSVTSSKLAQGGIQLSHLATNSITSREIRDNTISTKHFVENAVSSSHIAANSINSDYIASGAVDSRVIEDRVIVSEHVLDNSLGLVHLSASFMLSAGDIATGTASSQVIASQAVQTMDIAQNTLTTEDFADGSVTSEVIEDGSITASLTDTSVIRTAANIVANAALLPDRSVSGVHIATGAVRSSNIANGGVTGTSLGLHVVEGHHLTADLYESLQSGNTGVSGSVGGTSLGPAAVGSIHFQEGSVTSLAIKDGEVKVHDLSTDLQHIATGAQSMATGFSEVVAEVTATMQSGRLNEGAFERALNAEEQASLQAALSAYSAFNLEGVATAISDLGTESADLSNYLGSRLTAGTMASELVGLRTDLATSANFATSSAHGQSNYLLNEMRLLESSLSRVENNIGILRAGYTKVKTGIALSQNIDSVYVERGRKGSFDLSFSTSYGIRSYGLVFGTRFTRAWVFNVAVAADEGFNDAMYSVRTNYQW